MGLLDKFKDKAKRAVRKIVPKEISGIMRVAAPFVAASNPLAGIGLSVAGQLRSERGRISPLETILAAAPSKPFRRFVRGEFDVPDALEEKIFGTTDIFADSAIGDRLIGIGENVDRFLYGDKGGKRGVLGFEGKFNPFKGNIIFDKNNEPKLANIFALGGAGLSFLDAKKAIRREGEDLGLDEEEIVSLEGQLLDTYFPGFDPTGFRPDVPGRKDGGLMRTKFAMGSKGKPRPGEIFEDSGLEFPVIDSVKPNVGKMASDPPIMSTLNDLAMDIFGRPYFELTEREKLELQEFAASGKPGAAVGGLMRTNYALGTRPTAQESGLGGLPIEADMRYTGGFMPYGAREKADDVPARLSKNEFVFTADAVRAAGGGSINKGAKRMYNTMKQLESMGRA